MNEVTKNYLETLRNLKVAQKYLIDIEKLQRANNNYNFEDSANVISEVLLKYKTQFNYIGKHYTNYFVVKFQKKPIETYSKSKTEDEVFSDIEYVHDFLVIIIATKVGLISDLDTGIKQLLTTANY